MPPKQARQMEHHCFSEECDDVPVHFQLLLLAQQVYIWVALGAPRLGNLTLAMPTRLDATPAATALLRGSAEGESMSMAQRIAKRIGRSVALSLNIPPNMQAAQAFAERRILQELEKLQLVQNTQKLQLADGGQ